MRAFEFDETGDWTLGMVEGKDEIVQSVKHGFLIRLGEWFLDESIGLDRSFFEDKKVYNKRVVSASLTECALQDDRVLEVISINLEFEPHNRILRAEIELNTTEGEITFDTII